MRKGNVESLRSQIAKGVKKKAKARKMGLLGQ